MMTTTMTFQPSSKVRGLLSVGGIYPNQSKSLPAQCHANDSLTIKETETTGETMKSKSIPSHQYGHSSCLLAHLTRRPKNERIAWISFYISISEKKRPSKKNDMKLLPPHLCSIKNAAIH